MGKVVERKKKKKGRPSLLDLQKRTLREQQPQPQPPPQPPQPQHQKRNYNSAPHSAPNYRTTPPPPPPPSSASAPLRRSTRRNPIPDEDEDEEEDEDSNSNSNSDDNGNESAAGKKKRRREKKLKLVLRLPTSQKSSLNSASLNSCNSDSIADDDNAAVSDSNKKRKINAIARGSDSLKVSDFCSISRFQKRQFFFSQVTNFFFVWEEQKKASNFFFLIFEKIAFFSIWVFNFAVESAKIRFLFLNVDVFWKLLEFRTLYRESWTLYFVKKGFDLVLYLSKSKIQIEFLGGGKISELLFWICFRDC